MKLLQLLLLLNSFSASAQYYDLPIEKVYSTNQSSVADYQENAASLTKQDLFRIALLAQNYFSIEKLNACKIIFLKKLNNQYYGVELSNKKWIDYRENEINIYCAQKLSDGFSIGAGIQSYIINSLENKAIFQLNGSVGITIQLPSNVIVGFSSNHLKLKQNNQPLFQSFLSTHSFGVGYDFTNQFNAAIKIVVQENNPSYFNYEFHYTLKKGVDFNLDINSKTNGIGISALFRLKKMNIEIVVNHHGTLGFSSAFLCSNN